MIDNSSSRRPIGLRRLSAADQQRVIALCETATLEEAVAWLKEEFDLHTTASRLSSWLRRQREKQSTAITLRKVRPDSRLGMLKPEQQEAIFAHCQGVPLTEGQQWLKAQFNIDLSSQALGVWLRKRRLDNSMEPRLARISDARDSAVLVGNVIGAATAITEANIVLLTQAVFEELIKPEGERDEKRLAQYMSFALKARGQDFTAERSRIDIAKKAREMAAELHEINRGDEDEREKIQKVIRILFGERPSNTTFQPQPSLAPA
jgi:hypothetical protein